MNPLTLNLSEGTYIIHPGDIICLKASSNYTKFYLCGNKTIFSAKCLKAFHHLLGHTDFCRVHKSYVVNKKHIIAVHPAKKITLSNGQDISISKRKRNQVKRELLPLI